MQKELSLVDWLKSAVYFETGYAQCLLAVIEQAVSDADMSIPAPPDPPPIPTFPANCSAIERKTITDKYYRKLKNRKSYTSHLHGLARERDRARFWLMDSDSDFPRVAAILDIDAETIRAALAHVKPWARNWEGA